MATLADGRDLQEQADWHRATLCAQLAEIGEAYPDLVLELADEIRQTRRLPAARLITVRELAAAIGCSRSAAYRLLEARAIPGAFKASTLSKSRWLIPGDSPARFLARGEAQPS